MNIKIVAVGKIKEKFNIDYSKEYLKRLSRYCSMTIVEIPAVKINSEEKSEINKYKREEGQKILAVIKPDSFVITLEIEGNQLSSEQFSKKIDSIAQEGTSEIVFIVGGANGLDEAVLERSDYSMSISKMTFTHQMVRNILMEQIYRAYKISKREPYHR